MFDNYGLKYPNLIRDILLFFSFEGKGITKTTLQDKRSVLDFCSHTGVKNGTSTKFVYDVSIIYKICQKLADLGYLLETHKEIISTGPDLGASHYYIANVNSKSLVYPQVQLCINSQIFGFEYIYNYYRGFTKPLIFESNGEIRMGTAFEMFGGIFTARHCIENMNNLMILGHSGNDLNNAPIYIHQNLKIDVAFIDLKNNAPKFSYFDDGKVLQEVIVMGYPKVPTFHEFLTVEKANISSIKSRESVLIGEIAAFGKQYISGSEKMLITAKVAPGNSGSPVINSYGGVVGIVTENVESQDAYDFVGYGVCETSKVMLEIVINKNNILNKKCYNFVDWKY